MIEGIFTSLEEFVKIFDTKTKTWKVGFNGSQFFKNLNFTKSSNYTINYGSNELVIFGGQYYPAKRSNGIKTGYCPGLIIYNIKNDEWKTVGEKSGHLISGHNSVVHNGNLIIFGSIDRLYDSYIEFNNIPSFDIKNEKWYNQTTLVYILGGANIGNKNEVQFMDSSLYVLNLDNLNWEKHYVSGLIISPSGYLEYYNDHLFKSDTFSRRNRNFKAKSQVPVIVGVSVGGFLIEIPKVLYSEKNTFGDIPEPTHNMVFVVKDSNFSLKNDNTEFNTTVKIESKP
ncbi:hypothetical protein K502DRAFT_348669 [Neoconidiobolus thromboides FSU 785]|nr:hypothetical protein K502DRAFT_348669 [Neoconidiobolus thromboides FSU 785]